ncbi:MAG: diiron oxygenase [Betaproteobacteria bacterium]|nr:diiron oxygenase [Betaproteobacteria bacterium]
MPHTDHALLGQLSSNSTPYRDPLAVIDWGALDVQSFWLPEPALSLYGLPEYDTLALDVKRRLSQYEFINVMQAGLWLERVFLQRLSQRLEASLPRTQYEYFLHEVREEAGHSLMFLKAIATSGLTLPLGAWRAPRGADFLARRAPAGSVLFWLALVIGEDVPDKFNRYVRQNAETINPAVRQICTLHIVDEARHIAAARSQLEAALLSAGALRLRTLTSFMNLLLRQFVGVFYFPPARFYELAGLTRGRWWRALARRNPAHRDFTMQCLAPTLRLLESYGLEPSL